MRVMDGLMSIPPILLAIALMALTRASVQNVIIAIGIAEFPRVSRLVRGVVLSLREQPYVEAAIASGTRVPVIIWKHILPNTLAPLMVQATFICASAMITEATLSFIGAGTPPIIPSWGNIMAEGRALWQVKPYIVFFPAIFLSSRCWRSICWVMGCATRSIRVWRSGCRTAWRCSKSKICKRISARRMGWSARSKGCRFISMPGRLSGSSANPAAANRSPPCRSCG